MRAFSAVFALAALMVVTGRAWADAGQAEAPQKFNDVGVLCTGRVAIGGETTGVTLKTDHGTFELSMFGELARKAEGLNGKTVHVVGTWKAVPGVEVKDRKVVAVESLSLPHVIGEDGKGKVIAAEAGEILSIELHEKASTGYHWVLKEVDGKSVQSAGEMRWKADPEINPKPGGDSATGYADFVAVGSGKTKVTLEMVRPGAPGQGAAAVFVVTIDVHGTPPTTTPGAAGN